VLVYAIAAAVAAATLFGAIRLFGRRRAADDGTEADAEAPHLRVLEKRRVGLGRTLVVVEAEGRRLLLGSTRDTWTALADLGPSDAGAHGEPGDLIEEELNRALDSRRFRRGGRSK
jgi:flagellar biogenesis protein FliO